MKRLEGFISELEKMENNLYYSIVPTERIIRVVAIEDGRRGLSASADRGMRPLTFTLR